MTKQPRVVAPAAGDEPHRRRRLPRVARIALWALLLALVVWLGQTTYRSVRAALALRSDLAAVQALAAADVQTVDVMQARQTLHSARVHLEELRSAARPFLWVAPAFGWVPRYGPDVRLAPGVLDIATDLVVAGDELAEAMSPLLETMAHSASPQPDVLPLALDTLGGAQPQVEQAWEAVLRARAGRAALERQIATGRPPSPRVAGLIAMLDRALPPFEQGVGALAILAAELSQTGDGDGRTYLVLVQNEDELRATGGFISAVALVRLDRRGIIPLRVEDSYVVDDFSQPYPEPPAAVRETMLADLWVFRDANWSPDFPTSARAALELYAISRPDEAAGVDGVIAFDQQAVRLIVEALGPLEVAGQAEPITGEDVITAAREAWAPGEQPEMDWWLHRKDFYEALLVSMRARIERGLGREELIRLLVAGRRALDERDLLVALRDERASAVARHLGWDGALRPSPGDYLMVVHSNVGFNKADGLVEKQLLYSVDLRDPLAPTAALTVTLHHPGPGERPCNQGSRYGPTYEEMMQRCYWDYMRILSPAGTRLIAASRHPIAGAELLSGQEWSGEAVVQPPEAGRAVVANLVLVRPGETAAVRFDLALPPSTVVQRRNGFAYTLHIQKQPGTRGQPVEVRVLLGSAMTLRHSSPPPSVVAGNEVVYSLTLESDRTLAVEVDTTAK